MTNSKHDAIEQLKADHRKAEDLFEKYEVAKKSANKEEKYEIGREVCAALLIHMELEEMLFYPEACDAIQKKELISEAIVEHQGAKTLIDELGNTSIDSSMFDAKVGVLDEQIRHHVKEEENELFPRVRESELDLDELGKKMEKQKEQLCRRYNVQVASG